MFTLKMIKKNQTSQQQLLKDMNLDLFCPTVGHDSKLIEKKTKKFSHIQIVHFFDISITFMKLERNYRLFWNLKKNKKKLKLKLQDHTNWSIQEHHFWAIDH